ncbi:ribosome biogenesis GTPase Der [Buchnera aphidicola]|uniref:ribosome biogenesis GTPase Der n=1 Tax=Buchnera aphidicola TaxID=9 RepID=UPI0030EF4C79
MLTISLIGRENVGKSMLFNRLTKSKKALVSKIKGFTKDLNYGFFMFKNKKIILIDTAGIKFSKFKFVTHSKIFLNTKKAIQQSQLIFFVVDGKVGLTFEDKEIAKYLKKISKKNVFLIINKIDNFKKKYKFFHNFYEIGFKKIFFVSSAHGHGIKQTIEKIFFYYFLKNFKKDKKKFLCLKKKNVSTSNDFLKSKKIKEFKYNFPKIFKIICIGQPNAGKSTLINNILQEKKLLTSKKPGTTRDNIWNSKKYKNENFIFIDTAGIKKKKNVIDKITFFSIKKIINFTNVALLIIDASKKLISRQDLKLSSFILKNKISIIIIVNKWDILSKKEKKIFKKEIKIKFKFLCFLKIFYLSALLNKDIKKLLNSIYLIKKFYKKKIKSSTLNKILKNALLKYPINNLVFKKKIKLKYIHLGGLNPIKIIIHGTRIKYLTQEYKKYLLNFFKKFFKISGNSLVLYFKESFNPYKNNK